MVKVAEFMALASEKECGFFVPGSIGDVKGIGSVLGVCEQAGGFLVEGLDQVSSTMDGRIVQEGVVLLVTLG